MVTRSQTDRLARFGRVGVLHKVPRSDIQVTGSSHCLWTSETPDTRMALSDGKQPANKAVLLYY